VKLAVIIAIAAGLIATLAGAYLWVRKVSRRAAANGDESLLTYSITPTGVVLAACLVATLIAFRAAPVLSPGSPLAELLRADEGFFGSTIVAVAGFSIASALFARFGHPPFVRRGGGGSNKSLERRREE
jgi:hypothetical protein